MCMSNVSKTTCSKYGKDNLLLEFFFLNQISWKAKDQGAGGCIRKPFLIKKKFYRDLFLKPIGGTFLNPVTNDKMSPREIPIVSALSAKCGVFFGRKYIFIAFKV